MESDSLVEIQTMQILLFTNLRTKKESTDGVAFETAMNAKLCDNVEA